MRAARRSLRRALAGVIGCAALGAPAYAAPGPWSLSLKSGAGYDDDVAISQIDATSRLGDGVASFGATVGYSFAPAPAVGLALGYDFSQSVHATLHAYDLRSQGVSANLSTTVEGSTPTLLGAFYHITLGSKSFLDLAVLNPGVLTPMSHGFFLRTSLLYLNESFLVDHSRDASHYQPELQTFYFFDKARAFILVGANFQRETTTGFAYAYRGYATSASVSLPADALRKGAKVEAGYEWISRDYDNETPAIEARRRDRWSTLRLAAELPLTRGFSAHGEFSHVDRGSNLPVADYVENLVQAEIVFRR